jgi:hypothetical protein
VFSLLLLAGCAGDLDSESRRGTMRFIENVEPEEVLTEGATILRREFGRVEVDHAAAEIRTASFETETRSESGTLRDLVGVPSQVRRTATLMVSRRPNGTMARLRIDVDREDTRRREATPTEANRLSDAPGYSPIERDAATTSVQNTVWTRVGRSMSLERELLTELQERFASRASGTEPAPTATQSSQPGAN